jgi:hypothetical protein
MGDLEVVAALGRIAVEILCESRLVRLFSLLRAEAHDASVWYGILVPSDVGMVESSPSDGTIASDMVTFRLDARTWLCLRDYSYGIQYAFRFPT